MPSQQFSKHTQDVWNPAKGTGAVDMPILSQPGGASPQFKDPNPLAAQAAKMVGEIAYNAMAEGAAPKHVGYDDLLQKDIYEWQPNSAQYEPEGGWMLPPASVRKRDLEIARKEHQIASNIVGSQFEADRLTSDEVLSARAGDDSFGLASRGLVDAEGNFFKPSIVDPVKKVVIDTPEVIQDLPDELALGDPNQAPMWDLWDELKINNHISTSLAPISASIVTDFGLLKTLMPDWASKKDVTEERNRLQVVQIWLGANGGNNAFSYFKNLPNWYQELAEFKGNPIDYYYNKIAPTLGD